MSDWVLKESAIYAGKFKRYHKKNRQATLATLQNLNKYFGALQSGLLPGQLKAGYIHNEPQGVVAIDESGSPGRLRATRLYIYVVVTSTTVHLITIGDKDSQQRDLLDCRKFMATLKRG